MVIPGKGPPKRDRDAESGEQVGADAVPVREVIYGPLRASLPFNHEGKEIEKSVSGER